MTFSGVGRMGLETSSEVGDHYSVVRSAEKIFLDQYFNCEEPALVGSKYMHLQHAYYSS